MVALTESAILNRVIDPQRPDLVPEAAEFLLKLDFGEEDHARMAELSTKANEGTLSEDEGHQLDTYIFLSDFFAILQSKARQSLNSRGLKS